MKAIITKYKLELIGAVAGAIAGWCYWFFVGCSTGTCAITSNPVNSSVYGTIMGSLLFGIFKKENKKQSSE